MTGIGVGGKTHDEGETEYNCKARLTDHLICQLGRREDVWRLTTGKVLPKVVSMTCFLGDRVSPPSIILGVSPVYLRIRGENRSREDLRNKWNKSLDRWYG